MAGRIIPSFVSRLILVVVIFATIGAALYVGSMFLEPVPVPFPPPPKAAVKFDARADVSKNPVFPTLQPIGPTEIVPGQLGRVNPFAEVPPPATSTASATSTPAVPTSTVEEVPTPEIPAAPTSTPEAGTGTQPAVETPPPPAAP